MGHRTSDSSGSGSPNRGNRRTRGGAGRHNTVQARAGALRGIRVCLGCDRSFRSQGPWNRFCGRCHEREVDEEDARSYRVPHEWPAYLMTGLDDT